MSPELEAEFRERLHDYALQHGSELVVAGVNIDDITVRWENDYHVKVLVDGKVMFESVMVIKDHHVRYYELHDIKVKAFKGFEQWFPEAVR